MSARSNAGRIGVWGASGSGKSSYVKKAIKGRKRMVVFDPLGEYSALCNVTATNLEQVRVEMRYNWANFSIAYVPPAGQEPRALSALCKLMMAAQMPYKKTGKGQGMTLIVEEMNLSFPVQGGAQKSPGFAEVCSRGRHYGIEVYGLSQRIAEVSTRFRGNCTETVVLRQQGPRDLAAATDAIGGDKAAVAALANLDYIHERQGTRKKGRIKF
jgi:DNA helicase HerA-like ATPase|tara:strand:- start:3166 stop:3804 length:639 start_codon:yes stop_codon:yes gene_type:complete